MRKSAPLFLQSLTVPPQLELAEKALKQAKREKGSLWTVDKSISPYDLYSYLKARFGAPNGLSMLFRSPSTDNLIQWHYTLKSGEFLVEFFGFNTRVEIWIEGHPNLASEDWAALISAIKADFKNHGPRLKKVRAELEEWRLFYNPCQRLESVVKRYAERLAELDIDNLRLPEQPPAHQVLYRSDAGSAFSDVNEFTEQMTACGQKYAEALELCTSLRVLTPIWGEAFINLLIFTLTRDELKRDPRLYEDYRRKEIDIRVKLLAHNCIGFAKPVDEKANEFRDFLRLMNDRNDLLHGNTDPSRLSFQTVYFDDMIPLFPAQINFAGAILRNSLVGIEPSTALAAVETVRKFIDYILSLLEKDVRDQVQIFMRTRDLGWRPATKRIGILFAPGMVEGYLRRSSPK